MIAVTIEPFDAPHTPGIIDVIATVFTEYGMTFDLPAFDSDLLDIRQHYVEHGGWFSVLLDGGRVVGTVAAVPREDGVWEIKRLYLLPEYRGRGHGRALLEHAVARLREAGGREVIAWSDVRLGTAHRVYERLGFERVGERVVDDIDQSQEYGFRLRLPALPASG